MIDYYLLIENHYKSIREKGNTFIFRVILLRIENRREKMNRTTNTFDTMRVLDDYIQKLNEGDPEGIRKLNSLRDYVKNHLTPYPQQGELWRRHDMTIESDILIVGKLEVMGGRTDLIFRYTTESDIMFREHCKRGLRTLSYIDLCHHYHFKIVDEV